MAYSIAEVAFAAPRIPDAFSGFKVISSAVDLVVIAHLIEDEEFGFRAEVTVVGNAGKPKVALRPGGDASRVKPISFLGHRVNHVGEQAERWFFIERVD